MRGTEEKMKELEKEIERVRRLSPEGRTMKQSSQSKETENGRKARLSVWELGRW